MVRAGEAMGRLDQAIRAVIRLVEWNDALRAQIRKAAAYPLLLVGLLAIIVGVVSVVSLPSILKLLEELDIPLPLVTRVFIKVGFFLTHYGWLLVAAPLVLGLGLKAALRNPGLRLRWDTALLALPGAGSLILRMALARFAHFFAAQYRAGIPLPRALRTSEEVAGNLRIGLCVRALREGVEQGRRMADVAARIGYFPPLVIRMLALGEDTGNLEEALGKIATYFDREVEEEVRVFFLVLDPALKLVLACGLIFVATAILLPLYMLIGGINNG
jgi:type IV pilus assembly protein PilC